LRRHNAVYYNENHPGTVQWLHNLIARRLIPAGDVDDRSIIDVKPSDLRGYRQVHLFAGIGGWSYAARLAGWPDERELWTASCPCQPFSPAGRKLGLNDPRHLWPYVARLVGACQPTCVVGEQTSSALGYAWFDGVAADLEEAGYACAAVDIPAVALGAPHRRQRLWWVAMPAHRAMANAAGTASDVQIRCPGERTFVAGPSAAHTRPSYAWVNTSALCCADGKWRHTKPGLCWVVDGLPRGVGSMRTNGVGAQMPVNSRALWRGFGSAIVPQVGAEILAALL
jgi:DNA (cytosine-5)-methyltransferase 1